MGGKSKRKAGTPGWETARKGESKDCVVEYITYL